MWPRFTYENYQDVRHNLFWYSLFPLNVAGFIVYNWILPPTHQRIVTSLTDLISQEKLFRGASGAVAFSLLAFLLVEIIKIHDRWYDRYLVKWRARYSTDFIMPHLLQPLISQVDERIFIEVEQHLPDFMEEIYYPFVGDRDLKIRKNLLVRFYERITIYWMTQMNELVLIGMAVIVIVYSFLSPWIIIQGFLVPYGWQLLGVLIFVLVCFALNRLWVTTSREAVREATAREIGDIIQNHYDDLKSRVRAFCQKYNIPSSV